MLNTGSGKLSEIYSHASHNNLKNMSTWMNRVIAIYPSCKHYCFMYFILQRIILIQQIQTGHTEGGKCKFCADQYYEKMKLADEK